MSLVSGFQRHTTVLLCFLCYCGLALAQDGDGQTAVDDLELDDVTEEVIVSARRKLESIQDVPISITVLDEEQISNANMVNASDLSTLTPSLSVDTRFGLENTSFAIRGFYQSLRTTPSVAVYFADVVAPRGTPVQTSGDGAGPGYFFDLQNIQVLKGPQGTLFGRNTTGGSVLLVPNEPTDIYEGFVEASVGNFNSRKLSAVLNIPMEDNLNMRLSVDDYQRDGHLNNVSDMGPDKLGNSDYTAIRLSFLWSVTDTVENYTIFNFVDSESNGYSSINFVCNPGGLLAIVYDNCTEQLARQAAAGNDGFYDVASAIATPISTIRERRVINTTTWEITDDIMFKNIAAYAHLETNNGSPIFGDDFPLDPNDPNNPYRFHVGAPIINKSLPLTSQETVVEEMQLQGSGLDESLTWQTGLYYEKSQPDGFSGYNTVTFMYCDMAKAEGDPAGFDCYDPNNGAFGGLLVQYYKTEYLSKAVYGQATYDFNDSFSMTAGLRYTRDEVEGYGLKYRYTFNGYTPNGSVLIPPASPEVSSEKPSGVIEFNFHPTGDLMTYAKYTRGYRQGSVNLSADSGLDEHDPETIDSYEIGLKSTFRAPMPGKFNIALFDNELNDMQLQSGYISPLSGPTTAITNAGKATSRGAEVELSLRLYDGLNLNIAYTYLDTELKDIGSVDRAEIRDRVTAGTGSASAGATAAATFTPIADAGDELPNAPKHSWVVNLNYQLPVPVDMGELSVGATYTKVVDQRGAATSSGPYGMLPDFELLNLNANWYGIYNSNFDLSLYATNALDEEYITYIGGVYNTLGLEVYQPGLPRMYGARLRYNFGGL